MTQRLLIRADSSGRSDDHPETISRRVRIFKREQPVSAIELLEERGSLRRIDANNGTEQATFDAICEHLGALSGMSTS